LKYDFYDSFSFWMFQTWNKINFNHYIFQKCVSFYCPIPFKRVFHGVTAVMQQAQRHYLPKQNLLENQFKSVALSSFLDITRLVNCFSLDPARASSTSTRRRRWLSTSSRRRKTMTSRSAIKIALLLRWLSTSTTMT